MMFEVRNGTVQTRNRTDLPGVGCGRRRPGNRHTVKPTTSVTAQTIAVKRSVLQIGLPGDLREQHVVVVGRA